MPKFRVPIQVSVAPVQTYSKTITVEAASRAEAARIIKGHVQYGNSVLSDAINSPGWKVVGGRLEPIQPDKTAYDHYLNEEALDSWAADD